MGTAVHCLPEWQAPVWVLTGFACYSARKSRSYHAGFRKCSYTCCACYSPFPMLTSTISRMEIDGIRRLVCPKAKRMDAVNGGAAVHLDHRLLKAPPHNSAARRAMSFPPSAACKFLDLPPVNLRNFHLHLTKNPFAGQPPHLCGVTLKTFTFLSKVLPCLWAGKGIQYYWGKSEPFSQFMHLINDGYYRFGGIRSCAREHSAYWR